MSEVAGERVSSTHQTEVVRVGEVLPHPNADQLEVVPVYGYRCVSKKGQFPAGALAAYVVPDSVVDTCRPEFAFLAPRARSDGSYRVKAQKLRGEWSEGLLVEAPQGSAEGDDVAALLGVTRYEPLLPGSAGTRGGLVTGGEAASPPAGVFPKYDLEAFNRYGRLLTGGEEVLVTEKLHGTSARYLFQDGVMYCGSRGEWKKEYPTYDHLTVGSLALRLTRRKKGDDLHAFTEEDARREAQEIIDRVRSRPVRKNLWWQVLDYWPGIRAWCEAHPGSCLYGEVFGQVQDLKYGATAQLPLFFAAFDVWDGARFLDHDEFGKAFYTLNRAVPAVPQLYRGPYSEAKVRELADGPTTWQTEVSGHCREGVVVRPVKERWDPKCGRVVLKLVSRAYLSRA